MLSCMVAQPDGKLDEPPATCCLRTNSITFRKIVFGTTTPEHHLEREFQTHQTRHPLYTDKLSTSPCLSCPCLSNENRFVSCPSQIVGLQLLNLRSLLCTTLGKAIDLPAYSCVETLDRALSHQDTETHSTKGFTAVPDNSNSTVRPRVYKYTCIQIRSMSFQCH